jgi:hypothetical protein
MTASQPERSAVPELLDRFGSAKHPERPAAHQRPAGVDDATVEAVGQLSAALEVAEDARGALYRFHRLSGTADLAAQDALAALRAAGHAQIADVLDEVLIGRDVAPGMWTFQLVEHYDAHYLDVFRACEQAVRADLGFSAPHVAEAEMKVREQS